MAAKTPPRAPCAYCGAQHAENKCGRCREVKYCSSQCQRKHWKAGHKNKCDWCRESFEVKISELMASATGEVGAVCEHGKRNQSVHLSSEPFKSPHLRAMTSKEKKADEARGAPEALRRANELLAAHGQLPMPSERPAPRLFVGLRFVGTIGEYDIFCDEEIASAFEINMVHADPTQAVLYNKIVSRIAGKHVFGPVIFKRRGTRETDANDVCVICQEGNRTPSNSLSLCGDLRHSLHNKCAQELFGWNPYAACPSCRKDALPGAKSKVFNTDDWLNPRVIALRRIISNNTSIVPESLNGTTEITIHKMPSAGLEQHLEQLEPMLDKLVNNKKRDEAIVLIGPCYVLLKGIRLKPGATPITLIQDPEKG